MLYALAVGMGADPMDRRELAFVLEDRLATIPTMATVLAWNDRWLFTSPVFPGETLRTEMWRDGRVASYRTRAVERDVVVLDHGKATLAA